jgi:glycosyltransferase involved in cell wall biosynthesis
MKILLALHGYPPELVGGTENAVRELAHGLVRAGHEVVVVAGTMRYEQGFRRSLELDELEDRERRPIRVHRIHRADLYFDHWQKSASARASQAFADVLREERPDVVHVHHWIRLSRDLVHRCALAGVPAVVTLHDLWTTCLLTFRVRPETQSFCQERLGPSPCLRCAAQIPPRTPWLSFETQGVALLERSADLRRELELARAVITPSRAHAEAVLRYLGLSEGALALCVVPLGRTLELTRPAPPPEPSPSTPLVLGSWGHLHRLKGADLVLQALRLLPEPERVELHLAGGEPDPNYAREVRELARGLKVHLHGPFESRALATHPVGRVHAFVSGTRAHESFGLVLDEAVALGLPMVLPKSGAYAERLAEGAGALFYAPLEPRALAGVLTRLLTEPGLLAELRTRLPALEAFAPSVAGAVRAHLELYEAARSAGAPRASAVPARERIWQAAEDAWGAALPKCTGKELGFE